MNWNQLEGKWDQLKGSVKEKWGKLTDDDLMVIKGNRDKLMGKLQEKYGFTQERVEQELDTFSREADSDSCGCDSPSKYSRN